MKQKSSNERIDKDNELEMTEERLPVTADDDDEDDDGDENGTSGKRKRKRKRKKKVAETDAEKTTNTKPQDTEPLSKVEHTVYVEGIPFDATPDQVQEFFSKGGIEDIVELRLPTWQDSGRLRGYGHILFASSASYEKALTLSGQNMGKRYLTIQAANTPRNTGALSMQQAKDSPPPPDCRTLFVNNLPYDAMEEDIAEVFESLGVEIAEGGVRIARNSVTRQSKGFCYIDFNSPNDAQKIMSTEKRITVKGRAVRLDWDTGRMKGSFKSQSGRLWTKDVKEKKKAKISHN